jgi:hypothetical protein
LTFYKGKYRKWAKSVSFLSKLPGDIKKRKKEEEEVNRTLDRHFTEKKMSERVIHYSDKLFRQAAVEWLVATDQVCNSIRILKLFSFGVAHSSPRTSEVSGYD